MANPKPVTLILASQSPRRKKILQFLSVPFRSSAPHGLNERALRGEKASNLVKRLALAKAQAVAKHHPHDPVLAADTVVVQKNRIYGKPKNEKEARDMIGALQDAQHEVWTGIALVWQEQEIRNVHVEKTRVSFRKLSSGELRDYVQSREPYDKAGGYDIQGTASRWIEKWEGDYFNVMGLPIQWVVKQIDQINRLKRS